MSITQSPPSLDFVTKIIKEGIQRAVSERYEEYKTAALKTLEEKLIRDRDIICTGIVLDVMKLVSFEDLKERLVITIKK